MWKKDEETVEVSSPVRSKSPAEQLKDRAIIGSSIRISGELTGEEDLLIHGQVEGKIDLKQHNITVGKNGRVKADVYAKVISVEGQLQGNLFGDEKVVIRQSGTVRGNIAAPRVNLEEGSKFKGSIDMDSEVGQRSLHETAVEEAEDSSLGKRSPGLKAGLKRNRELSLGVKASSSSSKA